MGQISLLCSARNVLHNAYCVIDLWLWRFRGRRITHLSYYQIGKGDGRRRISGRACKYTDQATGIIGIGEAELEPVVQKQAHFRTYGPYSDFDLSRRAGRDISAGDGLMQDK